jgi:hypothetical protein
MYGIPINGHNKALCPFHADQKPSMHIYPGNRGFYCYVCNKGGSVIDFVMGLFNLDFHDAIRKINSDFGLHLPIDSPLTDAQQQEADRQAYIRKREQERRRNELKTLCTAYSAAYDKYAALDIIMRDEAPKGPYDDISPHYEFACKHIDAAWEEVQDAADRLREFERKER